MSVVEQLKRRRAAQITDADLVALGDVITQHMRETTLPLKEVADAVLTELEKPNSQTALYQCRPNVLPRLIERTSKHIFWQDMTLPELTLLQWLRYCWCRRDKPELTYQGAHGVRITKADAVAVFGWVPPADVGAEAPKKASPKQKDPYRGKLLLDLIREREKPGTPWLKALSLEIGVPERTIQNRRTAAELAEKKKPSIDGVVLGWKTKESR
ncbi:MAG: hypothetical protein HEQ39_12445 [Rhizobacter sp.]